MQYTDNEAALIGGLISNYFLRPAVSAALKDSYTRVLEHLRTGRVSAADLKQIQKALAFLTPTCQMSREAQRDLMGASLKTTAMSLSVASSPFMCVRSIPWLAQTPLPISAPLQSSPACHAAPTSEP